MQRVTSSMPKIIEIVKRLIEFFVKRALPIFMLWASIAIATVFVPANITSLLTLTPAFAPIQLQGYLDWRLLLVFFLGLAVLLLVFSFVDQVLNFDFKQRKNVRAFLKIVWDEISSASTHIGAGLIVLWAFSQVPRLEFPLVTIGYLALGAAVFKHTQVSDSAQDTQPDIV
jgi:hypothetical protein